MVRLLMLVSLLSLPALADEYVVAAKDLPAGSTLTMEVVSQKRSAVKVPGALPVDALQLALNQRLMVPLKKGDLLLWFTLSTHTSMNERCNKSGSPR